MTTTQNAGQPLHGGLSRRRDPRGDACLLAEAGVIPFLFKEIPAEIARVVTKIEV